MHNCRRILLSIIAIAATLPATAQDERLTLEWIFSDDGRMETALPRQTWLDAERLVTYDLRLPKDERTLVTVDADNGRFLAVPADNGVSRWKHRENLFVDFKLGVDIAFKAVR